VKSPEELGGATRPVAISISSESARRALNRPIAAASHRRAQVRPEPEATPRKKATLSRLVCANQSRWDRAF